MTTEENPNQIPSSTTDTYKEVKTARPTPIERDNGDCTLQVDDRDCTLETSDRDCTLETNGRDCTLEVDRRVDITNKEAVNINHNQADESGGPGLSIPVQRKRRPHRKWFICGVSIAVLLVIIIVPAVIATKH
ncbi:hypothetical protein N7517_009150 [Penicillium concentricum]|uniref:Uncharacterized protein n=1 Tax=Penicillium concentricum TaxID=293559 RepID=A0A9W9RJF6_9EURO|nr:uncharacterized protein N7517_009150 [Penicillium concentricum]KAJ5359959.1 hypothetical protein N7517_009150 [Penicillium concentricum]